MEGKERNGVGREETEPKQNKNRINS